MRVTYDAEGDLAYVYLKEKVARGEAAATFEVRGERNVRGSGGAAWVTVSGIMLDFDAGGRLIGIEVLAAKSRLPAELLAEARQDG